jgi:hypothetical protein
MGSVSMSSATTFLVITCVVPVEAGGVGHVHHAVVILWRPVLLLQQRLRVVEQLRSELALVGDGRGDRLAKCHRGSPLNRK